MEEKDEQSEPFQVDSPPGWTALPGGQPFRVDSPPRWTALLGGRPSQVDNPPGGTTLPGGQPSLAPCPWSPAFSGAGLPLPPVRASLPAAPVHGPSSRTGLCLWPVHTPSCRNGARKTAGRPGLGSQLFLLEVTGQKHIQACSSQTGTTGPRDGSHHPTSHLPSLPAVGTEAPERLKPTQAKALQLSQTASHFPRDTLSRERPDMRQS